MQEHFQTSDLHLAAYLLASGHCLTGIDGRDRQRVVFFLDPVPTAQALAAYADGSAVANVLLFVAALRRLKRRVWDVADGRDAREVRR